LKYSLGTLESPLVRYLIGGIIGLLVGVLIAAVGSMYDLSPLSIDGIFDAIVTIVVGCALAFVLQHLFHNQQREKDYLMNRLEKLSSLAEQLREQGTATSADQIPLFKQMGTSANGILQIVKELGRDALPTTDFDFTGDVLELKQLADQCREANEEEAKRVCNPETNEFIKKLTTPLFTDLVAKSHALCGRLSKAELLVIRA